MNNNRTLIIGAAVLVAVAVAYFMFTANEVTPPQPAPAATTQPKS